MYGIYHNYKESTGEYICSGQAIQDPLDPNHWLVPAWATETSPPEAIQSYARCFLLNGMPDRNGQGAWEQVEDHRGQTMYAENDATAMLITFLGPIPDGYTLLVPCEYPIWSVDHWEVNQEEKAAAQSAQLRSDAQVELDHSDITVVRCYEHVVPVPQDWVDYRHTLRDIIDGLNPGPIPPRPPYPPGT